MPDSSDDVPLGRIPAGQEDTGVWVRRTPSAVAWGHCHLASHWLSDKSDVRFVFSGRTIAPVRQLRQRPRVRRGCACRYPVRRRHASASERWGEGTVWRYDGDQVTALFDEHGYRNLLVLLALERGLPRPASSADSRQVTVPLPGTWPVSERQARPPSR